MVTKQPPSPQRRRPPAATGAERQHKHRAARKLSSVAAVPEVLQRLTALRTQTGLTNTQILLEALDELTRQQAAPDKATRKRARPSQSRVVPLDLVPAPAPKMINSSLHNENAAVRREQLDLLGDPIPSSAKRPRKR